MTRPEAGTDHNTDYLVYLAEESCTCVCPEDDISAWDDDHPWGEGVSGWEGRICHKTIVGTYCEECSDEQGDWFPHMPICLDCEYTLEDDGTCQCEPSSEGESTRISCTACGTPFRDDGYPLCMCLGSFGSDAVDIPKDTVVE